MDGQKGHGERRWRTRRKSDPRSIHTLGTRSARSWRRYISVLLFLRRRLIPFSLINSRAKYSAESLVYTGHVHPKTLYAVASPPPSTVPTRSVRRVPFIARFESARPAAGDEFRCECHSDRVLAATVSKNPKFSTFAGIVIGYRILSVIW